MPHRVLACVVQRRVYWLLDPSSSLVLVHYLQLELPNSTADQQLPAAAAACAPDGGKVIAIAPSLDENEAPVPSAQRGPACPQAVPVPSPTSTLPLAFAKRAALAPRTGASAASSVLAMKPEPAAPLTPIVAASPELAICGGEFTLILVLATPIRDAGLVCVFGLEKVRRARSTRPPPPGAPHAVQRLTHGLPNSRCRWHPVGHCTQYPRVPPGCVRTPSQGLQQVPVVPVGTDSSVFLCRLRAPQHVGAQTACLADAKGTPRTLATRIDCIAQPVPDAACPVPVVCCNEPYDCEPVSCGRSMTQTAARLPLARLEATADTLAPAAKIRHV